MVNSDTIRAHGISVALADCPQCAASKSLQVFYAMQHERLTHTINTQSGLITSADRDRTRTERRLRQQRHVACLIAFAGWFSVALGLVTRW